MVKCDLKYKICNKHDYYEYLWNKTGSNTRPLLTVKGQKERTKSAHIVSIKGASQSSIMYTCVWLGQDRLTVNNRYTHREFKLKFSALLKDYYLKYAEKSRNNLIKHHCF